MNKIYQITLLTTFILCTPITNFASSNRIDIEALRPLYGQLIARLQTGNATSCLSTEVNQVNQPTFRQTFKRLTPTEKNYIYNSAFCTLFQGYCSELDQRLNEIGQRTYSCPEDQNEDESQAYYQAQLKVQRMLENLLTVAARTSSKDETIKFTGFGLELADRRLPSLECTQAILEGYPILIISSPTEQKLSRTQVNKDL